MVRGSERPRSPLSRFEGLGLAVRMGFELLRRSKCWPPSANEATSLLRPRVRHTFGDEQPVSRHFKRHRDPIDVVQRDVPRFSLDVSDERPVQASLESQRLLGPSPRSAQRYHVGGKDLPRRRRGAGLAVDVAHTPKSGQLDCLSQPCLSHNRAWRRTGLALNPL